MNSYLKELLYLVKRKKYPTEFTGFSIRDADFHQEKYHEAFTSLVNFSYAFLKFIRRIREIFKIGLAHIADLLLSNPRIS